MADVTLRHVYKVYDGGVRAVNDFDLDIKDKEFVVFVGPSGCGKSTTLRMIAGLEEITAGQLFIDGELMNEVEPKANMNGQKMTMPMLREFASWGLFRIEDESTRYRFYDNFYKAYYEGKVKTVDDIAEIGAAAKKG